MSPWLATPAAPPYLLVLRGKDVEDVTTRDDMAAADLNSTLPSANGSAKNMDVTSSLFEAAILAWNVTCPCILVLGNIGNTLIIAVLYRSKVMSSNMATYFLAIAVSDLLGLNLYVDLRWLRYQFAIKTWTLHEAVCKLGTWLQYASNAMSTWTLVVMVTQRALSIFWPHRVNILCSPRSAKFVIIALIMFAALSNSHFLYFSTIFELKVENITILKECNENYEDVATSIAFSIFTWIYTLTFSLLPFVVLLIDNVILIRTVVTSTRVARMRLAAGNEQQLMTREKKVSSMTLTLIFTSLSFFLLSFPFGAFGIFQMFFNNQLLADAATFQLLSFVWSICSLLWCSNYAVNFYLYFLTGRRFRAKSAEILCLLQDKGLDETSKKISEEVDRNDCPVRVSYMRQCSEITG
ncbi:cysteinyl leukotriene receptor 1-like [Pomacea canaliculata]|uniref:cysteinyl leukotriene receptor 1-like n=1 Tax=Pomacea canaliculata TaxID=400727 RepID=UPI000D73618A|nr:cysteinyl leukotriene receptor 1-like [Pomacea canaliculata]